MCVRAYVGVRVGACAYACPRAHARACLRASGLKGKETISHKTSRKTRLKLDGLGLPVVPSPSATSDNLYDHLNVREKHDIQSTSKIPKRTRH